MLLADHAFRSDTDVDVLQVIASLLAGVLPLPFLLLLRGLASAGGHRC
jgi:hypothetical protein